MYPPEKTSTPKGEPVDQRTGTRDQQLGLIQSKAASAKLPGRFFVFNRRKTWLAVLLAIVIVVVGYLNRVTNDLTKEDIFYINRFLEQLPSSERALLKDLPNQPFEHQVEAIHAVQRALIAQRGLGEGIPLGHSREPKDLYEASSGLCFDRSRVLEKTYNYLGLPTRHVFAFLDLPDKSLIGEWLTPESPTHAISEVKTSRGWMLVGSNHPWVAVTVDGTPCGISQMLENPDRAWRYPILNETGIYQGKCASFLYGLYSRHGRFYPPFNRIPDVNYRELVYNVTD